MVELTISDTHSEVLSKLELIVGKEHVSDDPAIRVVHSRDQSPDLVLDCR